MLAGVKSHSRKCGPRKGNMMANYVSLRGFVGSEIQTVTFDTGVVRGRFRMGANGGHTDRATKQWVDGPTSWFTVTVWRAIATNAVVSLHKGDQILLEGRLTIKEYTRKDGTQAIDAEIDADSIGPDLRYGTASFHKNSHARSDTPGGNWQGAGAPPAQQYRNGDDEEGEFPPDTDENAEDADDPNQDSDSDEVDDGGQAAALESSTNDLHIGEGVNEDTGEIIEESVPF